MTHTVTDCTVSAHIRHTATGTVFIPEHSRSAHVRLSTEQRRPQQRHGEDQGTPFTTAESSASLRSSTLLPFMTTYRTASSNRRQANKRSSHLSNSRSGLATLGYKARKIQHCFLLSNDSNWPIRTIKPCATQRPAINLDTHVARNAELITPALATQQRQVCPMGVGSTTQRRAAQARAGDRIPCGSLGLVHLGQISRDCIH